MIKVKKIYIENFANFKRAAIELDPNVTYLVGGNGDGKSTLGKTAIHAIMEGILEKTPSSKRNPIIGERQRFIYKDADYAKGVLTLHDFAQNADIIVTRVITGSDSTLTFAGPPGTKLNQEWLSSLFNSAFISSKAFAAMSSKDQALTLGIDVSSFDKELQELKTQYTLLGRELKSLGEPPVLEKVERVDVSKLTDEYTQAMRSNSEIMQRKHEKEQLAVRLQKLKDEYTALNEAYKKIDTSQSLIDVDPIRDKLNTANEINKKATLFEEGQKLAVKIQSLQDEREKNQKEQAKVNTNRVNYIKNFKFPFKNLSVDEEGGLLLDEKPIKDPYFSTGELIIITSKLHKVINPEFRYVYLQDFNLLDKENQQRIIDELLNDGFQLCIEYVSDSDPVSKLPNQIILKECEVIDSKDNE